MKRYFLTLAVILFALGAQAQDDILTRFAVKGGLTLSNFKYNYYSGSITYKWKPGFHLGAEAEVNLSENFAIQPELLFSTGGAKFDNDRSTNLSFINIPVLVKYKNSGFGVYLGPEVGYMIGAKYKYNGESEDAKEDFKSLNFSGVIGAEYTLESGFGVFARYVPGIASIIKVDDDDYDGEGRSDKETVRNNGIQIGVHYFFK